jgi:hemerythrin-like domain-containing protein
VNLIDILLGEHGVFYCLFDNLDSRVPKTERMGEVLSIARTLFAALASHTRLEEEILFNELEPHLGADGPLAVMREEHDEIHRTLDIARDAQQTFEGIDRLLHVLAVARQHFHKEEQILFKAARKHLGEKKLQSLGRRWVETRRTNQD